MTEYRSSSTVGMATLSRGPFATDDATLSGVEVLLLVLFSPSGGRGWRSFIHGWSSMPTPSGNGPVLVRETRGLYLGILRLLDVRLLSNLAGDRDWGAVAVFCSVCGETPRASLGSGLACAGSECFLPNMPNNFHFPGCFLGAGASGGRATCAPEEAAGIACFVLGAVCELPVCQLACPGLPRAIPISPPSLSVGILIEGMAGPASSEG